ncbi:MAG: CRISPR-associated endonuclease Cas2 [Mycoplasma sp.]
MRSIIFFDLPMDTDYFLKEYTCFRKNILKLGYSMIQNSVYVKVLQSKNISDQHVKKIQKILPSSGNIRILILTEKQYEDMLILRGVKTDNEIVNDTDRVKEV